MLFGNLSKNHKGHFGAILEKDISLLEVKNVKFLSVKRYFFLDYSTKMQRFLYQNNQLPLHVGLTGTYKFESFDCMTMVSF